MDPGSGLGSGHVGWVVGCCTVRGGGGFGDPHQAAVTQIPVATDDTALSLSEKLAVLGAELLLETLPKIATDNLQPKPQSDEGMTYASLLEKNDGLLDLTCRILVQVGGAPEGTADRGGTRLSQLQRAVGIAVQ